MTLIATWYPTEEQKLELEEWWSLMDFSPMPSSVSKMELYKFTYPCAGDFYTKVHFVDYPHTWHLMQTSRELIKAGYFTI